MKKDLGKKNWAAESREENRESIMVKLFLVEDEIIMRNGIKNNIDWEAEGISFVGEASDGELAYPQIQKLEPDILITDIKILGTLEK